ncbi:MAG: hypothetical protein OXG08_02615 [Gammaproteobacteria bacterium]|nr:hypothetical protein [Gammaproteobacteria bacterium]
MADPVSKTTTQLGFVLLLCLVVGYGFLAVVLIVMALGSPVIPIWVKVMVILGVVGMGLLLFSVIRQRLIESKTDKYKDVQP